MTGEDLKSTLDRLHQELIDHPNLDQATAQSLRNLASEIEALLSRNEQISKPTDSTSPSFTDRLQGMISEFELQHPKLTNTLSVLAERLSDMGI